MAVFTMLGSLCASYGVRAVVPPVSKMVQEVSWANFFCIVLKHNLTLVAFLIAGALSMGLSSVILLGINGISIGYDIGSIILTSPAELRYLIIHLPLEIVTIVLATCSSQQIGWTIFQNLVFDRKAKVPFTAFVSLIITFLFVFVAALAESEFRKLRLYGRL